MHPDAVEAMHEWMGSAFGNPSGSHAVARRAKAAIEEARDVVADFLGVEPAGVVFTSGGTEADNLAIGGTLAARPTGPSGALAPIVVSAVEHPAVTEAARAAAARGHEVRVVGVTGDGLVDLDHLRRLVDPDVGLVSVQTANNETGVLQPIESIAPRIRKWAPSAVFHTDAVQAAAWCDLTAVAASADLVVISGHKFGGPQGVGALGIRRGVPVAPILHGGGQEQERRSGTHNVAGVIGLAAAIQALKAAPLDTAVAVQARRDRLIELVQADVTNSVVTAPDSPRLPGHCHFRFPGVESEALLFLLDERGVCASAGAACASGALEGSPALLAMGVDKDESQSALRLTLGPSTTDDDVVRAAAVVAESVALLRGGRV